MSSFNETAFSKLQDSPAMNAKQKFKFGFIMWLCAATFYCFQFLIRVSPNVMTTQLMASFDIQACTLGAIISFYYWGYSLMQIPAGIMLDTIGPRRPLTLACFLCLGGCVLFALGGNIYLLALGRILMGIGSAFGFLTAIRIITTWFHIEKLGLFVGLTILMGTSGGVCGSKPLGFLLTVTTWQNCMLILGAISGLLSILSWSFIRDHNPHPTILKKPPFSFKNMFTSLLYIVRNPQTWIFALYGFLMYIPFSGFADLWATPFMAERYKITPSIAAGGVFTFYVGVGIGGILWPLLADKVKSYKKILAASALLSAFFIFLTLYMENLSFLQSTILLGFAGLSSAGQFLAFSGITDINPRDRAATASGMHNMLCMFSGNLMQPLLGNLLHTNWIKRGGTFTEGSPYYILEDFHYALCLIPLALLFAAFIVIWLKETYPNAKSSDVIS